MPTLQNEEIRAIRQTIVALQKGIPLEKSQSKREQMKRDIKELQSLIEVKLKETNDFADIVLEGDVY